MGPENKDKLLERKQGAERPAPGDGEDPRGQQGKSLGACRDDKQSARQGWLPPLPSHGTAGSQHGQVWSITDSSVTRPRESCA